MYSSRKTLYRASDFKFYRFNIKLLRFARLVDS
jgi:hypothetical protein